MSLFDKCARRRAYNNIRRLHNMINQARTDYQDLSIIADTFPEAIPQRTQCASQLVKMYTDIGWMMRNYRLKYPKTKNQD